MDKDAPIALAVATYSDPATAVSDFATVMAADKQGAVDHVAVAVLTKGLDGSVEVERHDSTAKHLAWGGALVGGALCVVAPPLAGAQKVARRPRATSRAPTTTPSRRRPPAPR